jgi:hypothetical protein
MSAALGVSASAAAATQDDDNDSSFYMVENVPDPLRGYSSTDRALEENIIFGNAAESTCKDPRLKSLRTVEIVITTAAPGKRRRVLLTTAGAGHGLTFGEDSGGDASRYSSGLIGWRRVPNEPFAARTLKSGMMKKTDAPRR